MQRERRRPSGGRYITKTGYVRVLRPQHARADHSGYVLEHILVAERALGHPLPAQAVIHHRDENMSNNRSNNLVICQDGAYHRLIHARMRILKTGHSPFTHKICWGCGIQPREAFWVSGRGQSGLLSRCRACLKQGAYVTPLGKGPTVVLNGQSVFVSELAASHGLTFRTLQRRLATTTVEDAITRPRWAKRAGYHHKSTVRYTVAGETLRPDEWAAKSGMGVQVIYKRLKDGMSMDEIIRTPVRKKKKKGIVTGMIAENTEWAAKLRQLADIYEAAEGVLPHEAGLAIHVQTKEELLATLKGVGGRFLKRESDSFLHFDSMKLPGLHVSIWRDTVCRKIVLYECDAILSPTETASIMEVVA